MRRLFCAFLFIPCFSFAAGSVSLSDLVRDLNTTSYDFDLIQPKPFISDVQLRISGDASVKEEFRLLGEDSGDADKLEYKLRLKLDNLSEYQLKKNLYKNQQKRSKYANRVALGSEVSEIIAKYIELNLARKKYVLIKKLNTIYRDKVTVLKKLSSRGQKDVTDYLKAVEKLEENKAEIRDSEILLDAIVKMINSKLKKNYVLSDFARDEKLVSLDFIKAKLSLSQDELAGVSAKLAEYNYDKIQIETELDNEKRHKIVDFVDISYEEIDNDEKDRRISLQVGINIPGLNSNLSSVDTAIDSIMKKRRAREDYVSEGERFSILQKTLQKLVSTLKELKTSEALSEARRVFRIYSRRKATSPLTLLSLNEFIIKAEITQNESESELYSKFYEYMFELGNLKLENGRLTIKG